MGFTMPERSLSLLPVAASVRVAREFFNEVVCDRHGARLQAEAVLLLSELVANAVRHGSPPITLRLRCAGTERLEVRVRDSSPSLPVVRRFEEGDAEGGRGMALVNLLSDDWGVEREPDAGKEVWFRLKLPE